MLDLGRVQQQVIDCSIVGRHRHRHRILAHLLKRNTPSRRCYSKSTRRQPISGHLRPGTPRVLFSHPVPPPGFTSKQFVTPIAAYRYILSTVCLCELHNKALESSPNLCLITSILYVHSFGGCCFEIDYKRKERRAQRVSSTNNHIHTLTRSHSLNSLIYSLTLTHSRTHAPLAHPGALRCPALGLSRAPAQRCPPSLSG